MTPDQLKVFFDTNAILIMFVWGLLHKYVPQLAKIENNLIPWVNAIGYILVRLVGQTVTPAQAAGVSPEQAGALFNVGGIVLGAFTSAVWARQLYEGFGRFLLERVFKAKKAVPA